MDDTQVDAFERAIVEQVYAELAARKIRQEDAARLAGMSAASFKRSLRLGARPFDTREIDSLARVFGMEPEDLAMRALARIGRHPERTAGAAESAAARSSEVTKATRRKRA